MENYHLSKYNFFKRTKEKVIGLNLFDKRMFTFEISAYDKLMQSRDNLSFLEENESVLFTTMYKLGVIEDKDKKIPSILLLRNRERVFSNRDYRLIVLPTLNCNFSCWYCYETKVKKMMDESTVDNIKKFIYKIVETEKIQTLQLDWFGGEPLLGFEKVIKPIATVSKKICEQNDVSFVMSMTSNGFLLKTDMISFFKQHNMAAVQITLDGNEEAHNQIRNHGQQKEASYSIIVHNICEMAKIMRVILRINYSRESIDTCMEVISIIPTEVRKNIEVNLVQVWQDMAKCTKDERALIGEQEKETYRKFKDAGFCILLKQIKSTNEYTCYADLRNSAIINYDGRVFKCTATNFSESTEDGVLTEDGEIIWDEKRIGKRLARATFDNKYCLECEYLPICPGMCSNKPPLTSNNCFLKKKFKRDIMELMDKFDKLDYKIAHINRL